MHGRTVPKSRKFFEDIREVQDMMDLETYTFFFWPFFLKFLGFFPAVISSMIVFSTQGAPLLIINLINIFNI